MIPLKNILAVVVPALVERTQPLIAQLDDVELDILCPSAKHLLQGITVPGLERADIEERRQRALVVSDRATECGSFALWRSYLTLFGVGSSNY